MSAAEFSGQERHLLTHALAMGGWLSPDYVQAYDGPAGRLVHAGFAVYVAKDNRKVFALTAVGQGRATELDGLW